jgi:hypothetical protein
MYVSLLINPLHREVVAKTADSAQPGRAGGPGLARGDGLAAANRDKADADLGKED